MAGLCVMEMDQNKSKMENNHRSRPMGPLETMYHKYHKRGMDIYAQIIHLQMMHPVNQRQIREALECLVKRHPLLRMTIKEVKSGSSQNFNFTEMDPFILDLKEIHSDDLEKVLENELNNPLNCNEGPLWRFTVIHYDNVKYISSNLNYNFTFMFKCHHSLADGIYLHQLYSDFIEYLDLIQRGYQIKNQIQELSVLPAIEDLIPLMFAPKAREHVLESRNASCQTEDTSSVDALSAYNNRFSREINELSYKQISTKVVRLNMTEHPTAKFLLSCKHHKVSVTGACIAAACTSMLQLVRTSMSEQVDFINIPVEIMVNLRRYMIDKALFDSYPGVAAIHIPLNVKMALRKNNEEENSFWALSRQISRNIESLISSGKPLEVMAEESQSCDEQTTTGKSPFVICFTNLSSVDKVLKNSLKDRFKIERFPGITKVTVDDMPIFFIGAFTLNRMFNIGVEYCTSYTSENTAANFSWKLLSQLQNTNKL